MNLSNSPTFYSAFTKQWPFPIAMPDIHICYCSYNIDNFQDIAYQQQAITQPSYLDTAIAKRKAEYLIGRLCAREALQQLNIIGYPTQHKDKSPLWPQYSCGSITHSHHFAAAIVASQANWQGLGLDIEQLLTEPRSQKLASTILNDKEQQLLNPKTALLTTIAFSIKESLFKALYPLTHKRFYFEHAEIVDLQPTGEITLKLLIDLSPNWLAGSLIKGQYCIKENYIWSMIAIKNLGNE